MKSLCVTCEDTDLFEEYKKAGCDEVILALKDGCFSPLRSFEKEELIPLIEKLHALDLKAGILMNRLFHENDVYEAEKIMEDLILNQADHIIFADTALAFDAKNKGFMDRLCYQPETMMTSSFDAKVWSETGVNCVMISSLLTKDEIVQIASSVRDAGVNVHGYQMMSVSARPLFSAYAKQTGIKPLRDVNGLYLVEEKREGRMPVYENAYAAMIFSDYIQESFDEMNAFLKAGAKRFVIDSWHLEKECVLEAISIYRALIDGTEAKEKVSAYRKKYADLPLSSGYYEQKTVR